MLRDSLAGDELSVVAFRRSMRHPRVCALHFPSRPSNVAGLIVPVVVDSVERHRRARRLSDIGCERLERVPSLAHANAASAIVRVGRASGVVAPLAHAFPCRVKTALSSGFSSSHRGGVKHSSGSCGDKAVTLQAAARSRDALYQTTGANSDDCAAVTNALPEVGSAARRGFFIAVRGLSDETAETRSGVVNKRHGHAVSIRLELRK
jgi:hypothetical protein